MNVFGGGVLMTVALGAAILALVVFGLLRLPGVRRARRRRRRRQQGMHNERINLFDQDTPPEDSAR